LGGDPALCALGTVGGLQHAGEEPGIAWFDARSNFESLEPLALLTGRGETALSQGTGIRTVPGWQILLAGVREVSPETEAALDNAAVTLWGAKELRLAGAHDLGREAAEWPSTYLHLNLNVLDPAIMPAVDSPLPGGLMSETMMAGIESIAAASRVNALGITGFDPDHDKDGRGLITSIHFIEAAISILVV
jgi:arginase